MLPRRETTTKPLTDDEENSLKSVIRLMDAFRAVRPTMPLQHAYSFLLVALHEGLGVREYAEMSGMAQSVMTRNLLDLGSLNRRKEAGYGLVMQRMDPLDMRRHQTFLTPEGRALMHKIMREVS